MRRRSVRPRARLLSLLPAEAIARVPYHWRTARGTIKWAVKCEWQRKAWEASLVRPEPAPVAIDYTELSHARA